MITVFGLGFVGLTTALGFASKGFSVYGIDPDVQKTEPLKRGELPFYEKDMDVVLREQINTNFFITDDIQEAVQNSTYIFYCVGTPYGKDGEADLGYLFKALEQTLCAIDDDRERVFIVKSTVPPSTVQSKVIPFVQPFSKNVLLTNNPEFLREGHCWEDFINPDRIVIGADEPRGAALLAELYEPFCAPVVTVSLNTAEFIKYLSNTLLATLISFSNEMSLVADAVGDIDVAKAFRVLHMDGRWNNCNMTTYAYPGCGYGGYCLPKDTNALYSQSVVKGFEPKILKQVIHTNDTMPDYIFKRITTNIDKGAKIGLLGLSFKPLSDDVRDTPSAKIVSKLMENGYSNIYAYDPVAIDEYKKQYQHNIHYISNYDDIGKECDILVILTAWAEFKDAQKFNKPVVDCRYML